MSFVLSGDTITQSGTDTPATVISGLSGVAGVTATAMGTYTRMTVPYKLRITGDMTTDNTVQLCFTRAGTFAYEVYITGTGKWTAKKVRNNGGYDHYYRCPPVIFTQTQIVGWNSWDRTAITLDGGIMDFANIEIIADGGFYAQNGTVKYRDVTWNAQNLVSTSDTQWTPVAGAPTLDVIGFTMIGGRTYLGAGCVITNFSNYKPLYMQRGIGAQGNRTFNNFEPLGCDYDAAAWSGSTTVLKNASVGGAIKVGPWLAGNSAAYGWITSRADLTISATSNGAAANRFVVFAKDNNTNAPNGNTAQNVYMTASTAGSVTLDVLLGAAFTANGDYAVMVRRSATQTDDVFTFDLLGYDYTYSQVAGVNLAGLNAKSAKTALVLDTGITLSESAATALTSLATLDDLYDVAKLWKTRAVQAQLEYPTIGTQPVTGNGTILDLGSRNIVIDGTAASAFAVNTSTHTITIKASALAAGTKFKSLKTTGSVTLANGGTITSPYQDSTGIRASISGLDSEALGTTWVLGWITDAQYTARNTNLPPAGWTGWNQASGTGNSTQVTLAPNTLYQLFVRIPGYYAPVGPLATINTATQTSVSVPLIVDKDLTGALLWPQTAAHTTQAARFAYAEPSALVEYNNVTGATDYISFLAAYRALESIAKSPSLAYMFKQPLYVNASRSGFSLPRNNPLLARMSDASTAGAIMQADISYEDTQAPAYDRFLANPENAGNFLLIPQATAGLSVGAMNTIASTVAGAVDASTVLAKQAAVTALATANQAEHDATQAAIAALPVPTPAPTAATVAFAVRTELGTELARMDVAVGTRLAGSAYTAPDNATVAAIKAKTDTLTNGPTLTQIEGSTVLAKQTDFAGLATAAAVAQLPKVGDVVDANITKVTGVSIKGTGLETDPWGPVNG